MSVALILYAATPGAFVDLAADLSWITGRQLADFRLDEHRTLASDYADPSDVRTMSTVNQALGVLIARGSTPEQAERELHAQAALAGTDLLGATTRLLAALDPPRREPERC